LGFGGGVGYLFLAAKYRPLPPFRRGSFVLARIFERPDHSLFVVGGVGVSARAPDGTRVRASRFAVAALTSDLEPDLRFGGPPSPPRLRVRLLSRTITVSARLKRILVSVTASVPSLVLIRARVGRIVIADAVEPVLQVGRVTARLRLTPAGEHLMRRPKPLRVTVTATVRNLLAQDTRRRASGRMRR
jgi:hypothetical protein